MSINELPGASYFLSYVEPYNMVLEPDNGVIFESIELRAQDYCQKTHNDGRHRPNANRYRGCLRAAL